MELTTEQKTQFNEQSAMIAAAISKFSREELETMVCEYSDTLFDIRSALPEKGLLNADLAGEIEYIGKENGSLKTRIAELEQQVAALSWDKARLDWIKRTQDRIARENIRIVAELEQQVAELSKDKARLDWLQEKKVLLSCREEHTGLEGKYICEVAVPNDASDVNMGIDTCYLNADLRKAIDAAIAKEQEHE